MCSVYAAYHKNPEEVEKSSSGAVFVALSDVILQQGGKIVGAGYNYVTHKVEHMVCQTPEERDACRGSKYIQSHIDKSVYKTIESELSKGCPLLYVGTPCQVAAVQRYVFVKKINEYPLVTCDLLCHGVGSPGIWTSFLDWKKKEYDYLTFKDKRKGWKNPRCIAKRGNRDFSLRGYSWLYFADAIMRCVCYECPYANTERVGDLTIGDFWKADSKIPEVYNPRGTSFIVVNTEKGQNFFNNVKESLVYREVTLDDIVQDNLQHPTLIPGFRDEVMNDFINKDAGLFFRKWEIKLFANKIAKKFIR